jgi:hypothetical protein
LASNVRGKKNSKIPIFNFSCAPAVSEKLFCKVFGTSFADEKFSEKFVKPNFRKHSKICVCGHCIAIFFGASSRGSVGQECAYGTWFCGLRSYSEQVEQLHALPRKARTISRTLRGCTFCAICCRSVRRKDRDRRGAPANTEKPRIGKRCGRSQRDAGISGNAISEKTCIPDENTVKSVVDQIVALPKVDAQRPSRQNSSGVLSNEVQNANGYFFTKLADSEF